MHPLKELRKLLTIKSTQRGTVVATSKNSVTLATTMGSKQARKLEADLTTYQVGDSVVVINGTIVGKRVNNSTVYVL